ERNDAFGDAESGFQFIRIEWFRNEIIRAGFHAFEVIFLSDQCGNNDDVGVLRLLVMADFAAQFESIDLRHQYVGNHDAESASSIRRPSVLSICSSHDLITEFLQKPGQELT